MAANIDHTLSGFEPSSQEEYAVQLIYRQLMYASKPSPPCKEIPEKCNKKSPIGKRGPFFTVREHDYRPPKQGSHKEILIYGSTQLSKTPEAACTAWCAFFVDGCMPIIGVRNRGGANSGSTDMANGIGKLNQRIVEIFQYHVNKGDLKLPLSDSAKLLLHPRKTSDNEQTEFNVNSLELSRPQALIICMNSVQVKNLNGDKPTSKQSKAGATSGLLAIMKGHSNHPYPFKCHNPFEPLDKGQNRAVARVYFILDEDDLNRANTSSVTEKLQFDAPKDFSDKLNAGLTFETQIDASDSYDEQTAVDDEDSDKDDSFNNQPVVHDETEVSEIPEGTIRDEFKNQMTATGIRSAVRGVVALTATPAACGHDLPKEASQVIHQVCEMIHPANYVGCE